MADRLDGRWQVFGPAGTLYPALFQPLANVASTELAPGFTSFRVRYLDGTSILYAGDGLGYDGTTLSGTIAAVTVLDAADSPLATLSATAANPFQVDSGLAVHGGAALYAFLLSGDNLVVGSDNGGPGTPEVLAGGTGNDTYLPGNGHTTISDGVGVTTLDLSGLAGPATVDLLNQTFTVGGATGNMSGVTNVIGTGEGDTVLGNTDGSFVIATGAGSDSIQAYGETTFGARFAVEAGDGDDTIIIDQRGYGTIDGGSGDDVVEAGGDISFYAFRNVETLANTNFLRVSTDQLRTIEQITDLNPFNGDQVVVQITNDGTVDFGRLMAPGLTVWAEAYAPGTNVNGTAGNDRFFDFSTGIVDGFRTPVTFFGAGGDDVIDNNSGLAVVEFTGNMADYTITRPSPFFAQFIVTDNRPGSPDGTDTLNGVDPDLPMLRFRDHFASVNEQLAFKADPTQLPAQIYNGVLQLFGPDNFDYQGMFPKLDRAVSETLAADGSSYTIEYANFTRVVWSGTGLSTSAPYAPDGGSVTEITVLDTTLPGAPVQLARFYSAPQFDHEMKVPFGPDLLAGGARVYQHLMFGNNHVIGGPNDDFLVADKGFNSKSGTEGFDTLYLDRNVDSFVVNRDPDGNILGVEYVDSPFSFIPILAPAVPIIAIGALIGLAGAYILRPPAQANQSFPTFVAKAFGEPHITSFDGLAYSFQASGEFVMARSTLAGDPFEVQARTVPFLSTASAVEQTATRAGIDRVTFDSLRDGDDVVRINGLAADFSSGPIGLDGGVLHRIAAGEWRLEYTGGEVLTVTEVDAFRDWLNISLDPGTTRAADTLQGVLGDFDGNRDNDFQLADGTVLARPLSQQVLYTTFADAWRVTDATSLLDYGVGETTGTFTSRAIPPAFSLADLPPDVLARAEALVNAAGIADQALREFAMYDYVLTGDPAAITSMAAIAAQGGGSAEVERPSGPPAQSLLGIIAAEASVVEAEAGQPTQVAFTLYRTGPAIGDVAVDWQAVSPGAGFLDAGDFGGTLPSGSITIPNGQASATLLVPVPDGAITQASETLRVEISSPAGLGVIGAGAQVEVLNNGPIQGTAAEAEFRLVSGPGTLTQNGNDWVLDLGTIAQGASIAPLVVAVANAAPRDANDLSGLFETTGSLADFSGTGMVLRLASGGLKGGITAAIDTAQAGLLSSVLTFQASESNGSGYRGALADETLTIRASVVGSNAPPVANPDAYAVARGRVSVIDAASGIGLNDTDDGPLSFALLAAPPAGEGSVVVNADGGFIYTAAPDFVGLTSFTYTATDAGGLSATATVALTIEERAETLIGTGQADTIFGYGLDDVINGDAGDDLLVGGDGNDVIRGGTGNDTLQGGAGRDKLQGNDGDDVIDGGEGDDVLLGQAGSDTIQGGAGNDFVDGGEGDDALQGGAGNDVIHGGPGNDVIAGGAGLDWIFGGAGADRFVLANAQADRDWINDFAPGEDLLVIEAALFGAGLAPGALDPSRLVANANPVASAPGQFLFDTDNGTLRWDFDGAGGQAPATIARLAGVSNLSASDFIIV